MVAAWALSAFFSLPLIYLYEIKSIEGKSLTHTKSKKEFPPNSVNKSFRRPDPVLDWIRIAVGVEAVHVTGFGGALYPAGTFNFCLLRNNNSNYLGKGSDSGTFWWVCCLTPTVWRSLKTSCLLCVHSVPQIDGVEGARGRVAALVVTEVQPVTSGPVDEPVPEESFPGPRWRPWRWPSWLWLSLSSAGPRTSFSICCKCLARYRGHRRISQSPHLCRV